MKTMSTAPPASLVSTLASLFPPRPLNASQGMTAIQFSDPSIANEAFLRFSMLLGRAHHPVYFQGTIVKKKFKNAPLAAPNNSALLGGDTTGYEDHLAMIVTQQRHNDEVAEVEGERFAAPFDFATKDARECGGVAADVNQVCFAHGVSSVPGLERLCDEMKVANECWGRLHRHLELSSNGNEKGTCIDSSMLHRVWHGSKQRWRVVSTGGTLDSALSLAATKDSNSSRLWILPKQLPVSFAPWCKRPAHTIRYRERCIFFHLSQFAKGQLPKWLFCKSSRHYWALSGLPLKLSRCPLVPSHSSQGLIQTVEDLRLVAEERGEYLGHARVQWFSPDDLKSLSPAFVVKPNSRPYAFLDVSNYVCVPFHDSAIIDAEVREAFLMAFPIPNLNPLGGTGPQTFLFLMAERTWVFVDNATCTVNGNSLSASFPAVNVVMLMEYVAAMEFGLLGDASTTVKYLRHSRAPISTEAPSSTIEVPPGEMSVAHRQETLSTCDNDDDDGVEAAKASFARDFEEMDAAEQHAWGSHWRMSLSGVKETVVALDASVVRGIEAALTPQQTTNNNYGTNTLGESPLGRMLGCDTDETIFAASDICGLMLVRVEKQRLGLHGGQLCQKKKEDISPPPCSPP